MISLVLFIVGLINPSLVILRWKKRRFLVVLIYGTITLISLLLLIMISPSPQEKLSTTISEPSIVEEPSEEGSSENFNSIDIGPSPTPNWFSESERYFVARTNYPEQFTELSISLVTHYERSIEIKGETDLPDGSILEISFRQLSTPNQPELLDLQANTIVINKSFQVTFLPPENQQFSRGPFKIRVLFSPLNQIPQIQQIFGKKGEKLKGSKTRVENQIRILESIKEVSFEFEISTTPTY